MYIDHVGRQVLTHGTTWDEIDFGKCSVQPSDVGFCDVCKIYLRYPALERHNREQHSAAKTQRRDETELCLNLLNDTIKVEEERLKRVAPTDFDLAYIKQLHERRAKLEARMAA